MRLANQDWNLSLMKGITFLKKYVSVIFLTLFVWIKCFFCKKVYL